MEMKLEISCEFVKPTQYMKFVIWKMDQTLSFSEVVFDSIEVKSDVSTTLTCSVKGINSPFTFAWTDAVSSFF